MRSNFILVCTVFSLFLWSCDSKMVYDEYKSINEWNKDSIVTFNIGELDSLKAYNLFIDIRNNSKFKYSNLYLITEIQFPKGKVISDTLEYKMAEPNGEWLGTGFGDVKENKLWYKENVKFTEPGDYQVNIRHAMRKNGDVDGIENLEGITDVGFRIEKTTQNN
ncbi:gliding motility lipoprotein GldH [Zunongwangia sp. HRR-M8]|uniref:gliding motility lipoprotein GldH n=1 Tax=Zunongwangia sp. HRR-M8 TaxID=3015170 RepID=UPI0022DDD3E2|nr:gliding motility lipoprotein GldH [Zunongwangia sp. HRR-M8]WBL22435.1 gliding motility lipoprotein GldH [Zunongwangia sp. HRR-M8]